MGKEVDVSVSFCGVAGGAGTGPECDVTGQVGPDVAGRDEAAGGSNARVGQAVDMLEE